MGGVGSDRADFTGRNISQAVFGDRSHAQMVNQYFDTSLFTVNAVGTYGNAPRNMLANPGLFNIDMAAIKYFPVNEQMKIQFRAEFRPIQRSCSPWGTSLAERPIPSGNRCWVRSPSRASSH